jgi:hypothetical protein
MQFEELENILESDGIVFLTYGGFLTQPLIAGMTDALEKEAEYNDLSLKISGNIFTIFIELSQNMMNYSRHKTGQMGGPAFQGLVLVGITRDKSSYYIISRNIVGRADKERIEPRLAEIEGLDREALRKLYREKRKAGKDQHHKGAGIGFIEIARRCDKLEHYFEAFKNDTYYFTIKTTINNA